MAEDRVFAVYVTAPDEQSAREWGRHVIGRGLAACANVWAQVTSIYEWQGRVEEEKEAVLWLKTTEAHLEELRAELLTLHPYDCPCIVAWPMAAGHPPYLEWVRSQTRSSAR